MELKFQSNLDFQRDAIDSVIGLFASQKFFKQNYLCINEDGIIPNKLDLKKQQLLENLNEIQTQNNIEKTKKIKEMDFSIEMETGTGKTYVYLRTIFELYNNFGLKKFLIVVPSVAIREGVLKNLKITEKHFKNIYENISYRYYEYDSKKINYIRQFAHANIIEIMIITLDSFNKDSNIMNQQRDTLQGQKPIDLVSKTNPILILDEPQNMEANTAKESIKNLNPLFTLRYSATHKKYYNLIYRLTPIDAFNKNLVKKIEVSSVVEYGNYNDAFVHCADIKITSKKIQAKLNVNKKMKNTLKLTSVIVKNGDDLYKKTNNLEYSGYVVTEINSRYNFIKFSNGLKIKIGQEKGKNKEQIMKAQIKQTIEEHFRKYQLLKTEGIKPLSLFFIDKVDNYLNNEGFIKKTFEKLFDQLKIEFKDFKNTNAKDVHAGYFSKMKTEKSMEKDKATFDLIMKDKEKLLSFDEPVQFIFSHSALREGWDNPNVFNICTLNRTISSIKKRQEIGRGMRLPVNQDGDRITNKEYILTIVANESYENYAAKLQQEYIDEYSIENSATNISNGQNKQTLKLKKNFKLNSDFKKLWDKISKKTRYDVQIDSDKFIINCIDAINDKIEPNFIKIKIQTVELMLDQEHGVTTIFKGSNYEIIEKTFNIPNIVEYISNETNLTRNTVVKILTQINNLHLIFKNPQEFIASCILIIKEHLANFLVNRIDYSQIGKWYEMELFANVETYSKSVLKVNNAIYDGVMYDSQIEKDFADSLDKLQGIKLFIKLPRWFIITTPIGNYNPDWAIVQDKINSFGDKNETLYFVTETKGTQNFENLRPNEKRKIQCGKKHFESIGVDYKILTSIDGLK